MPDAVTVEQVRDFRAHLATVDRELDDGARIDLLRGLEELKQVASAAQAVLAADFDASQRAEQVARRLPPDRVGRGIAEQVALARRVSASRGARLLGLAKTLVHEMPHTLAALRSGRIDEYRATLLAQETSYPSRLHRATVDEQLAGPRGIDELERRGPRRTADAARALAYRLDPAAVVGRARRAESERHVRIRPAADAMVWLTGLLPVASGVGAFAALSRAADTARADGDPRGRGQVMADTLVRSVCGGVGGSGACASTAAVSLQLVMTDAAMLGRSEEPATVPGYGTVPAAWARAHLRAADEVRVRRLFASADGAALVASDPVSRRFPRRLRELVVARDRSCRTPWCDAPVRHADHVVAHADGGTTTLTNGQGLCERCNNAKTAPGWAARPDAPPGERHEVVTTTPTGHPYRSRAPALVGG